MRAQTCRAALMLPLFIFVLVLSGCAIGKRSILFATKTSYGVDIDTKPPTLDVGFTRKEGTLSPVLQGGEVLPQMASVSSRAGLIQTHVGQSFAVGNAAVLLAKYIATGLTPKYNATIPTREIERKAIVEGSLETAKRYFFGTDTSFGVKITFGLETGGYPDSLSLGWKRKELAYVPLFENPTYEVVGPTDSVVTIDKQNVRLPSLIATAGLGIDTKSLESADVRYTQFYATGLAANYLAAQPGVREVVGLKVISDPQIRKQIEEKMIELSKVRTEKFVEEKRQKRVSQILDMINKITDDQKAFDLNQRPPVTNPEIDKIVMRRDPDGKRLSDGKVAREILKMRVVLSQRSDADLDAWEAAFKATE